MDKKDFYTLVAVSLLAGLVGGLLMSTILFKRLTNLVVTPDTPKVVKAESFQVLDKTGRLRASLMTVADNKTVLVFFDQFGRPVEVIGKGKKKTLKLPSP